mmetsp:Transcript_27756/g.68269  ORF Transcript_27756/g.68269 Transcript_27756/m.68269 type:complete len:121 (-) Transcript_27756:639-1001(-)
MQSIHILSWVDALKEAALIEMWGHRKLQQDAVNVYICIKPAKNVQHFFLCDVSGEMLKVETDAGFFACLTLATHEEERIRPVADDDGGKSWVLHKSPSTRRGAHEASYLACNFIFPARCV